MYITEIVKLFYQDGVDDFEIKKIGSTIIFGYFKECPVDLITITNGILTEIIPSRNDKTEWLYKLLDVKEPIIDDYDCANCSHGLDIECATKFECELDGAEHYVEDYCNRFSE